MILTDIQAYLAKNQKASLSDLSTHFRMSADALSPMLPGIYGFLRMD